LPADQDPDDVLRGGLEGWQKFIEQAVPALDFYENLVLRQADLATPQGKSFTVRELIPIYREVKDEVERAARVQRLARKTGLDERLLLAELKTKPPKVRPAQKETVAIPAQVEPPAATPMMAPLPAEWGLEEYCLGLILAHPFSLGIASEILAQQNLSGLHVNDFKRGENREIFKSLQLWSVSETPKLETLVSMVDAVLERRLALLASQWHQRPQIPAENVNQDLSLAILRLRRQNIDEQIKELTLLQYEAMRNKDMPAARQYAEMSEEYTQQRSKLDYTRDALSLMGQRRAEANRFGQAF
jgi:DNA primase